MGLSVWFRVYDVAQHEEIEQSDPSHPEGGEEIGLPCG